MTVMDYCPQFHLGCRNLNSGPHACMTRALPTELSFPQAQASLFFANATGNISLPVVQVTEEGVTLRDALEGPLPEFLLKVIINCSSC